MRSVDSEFDHEFLGERTYLLCELQTMFEGAVFTCPVHGTKKEFEDYFYKCHWINQMGWVACLAQQSNCCHYHQVRNFVQPLIEEDRMEKMVTDPDYWYKIYKESCNVNLLYSVQAGNR